MVFAALIHDVDHSGVSNATLFKENDPIAMQYKGKSVGEQHSIAVAWELLMSDEYTQLRTAICGSDNSNNISNDALLRFRQVVKSAVLATDIADPNVQSACEARWEKTFGAAAQEQEEKEEYREDGEDGQELDVAMEWKAASVIECLVQASDVSHCMQHWHVYLKFTERLFKERFQNWKNGRASSDPSVGWVESELSFFDHYVIPLTEKLQGCGVFGGAATQYLEFARENRRELAMKGEHLVKEFSDRCQADFMAAQLQNHDSVPEPTSLSFRVSEGSSVMSGSTAAAAGMPPDLSFRISDQIGPGPGNVSEK